MAITTEAPPFRRAVFLVTVSSFLVPAAGLLTQPVLARALGAGGRGELTAALAPLRARSGGRDARAARGVDLLPGQAPAPYPTGLVVGDAGGLLAWGCSVSSSAYPAVPFLSAGNAGLGRLIRLPWC